jgi:EAL domain-containing protein (putative c-di-GMP-specific phosphodiesterase class I)
LARNIGLAHIIRHEDGTSTGVWGLYTLKSAFQPIFAVADGRLPLVAFEGLIRPFREGEPVSPAAFFATCPAGERLAVEAVTRTLHLLNAGACLPEEASVFINFDPSVFTERQVADNALREMRLVLHEAGIDPRRVVCEVTEQRSTSHETLFDFVAALKDNGFRIAVDDYGTDDSDIERIRKLKPDIVKFDGQWATQLMESGPGFALLTTMVSAFERQGIQTLFEGIEEGWQLELTEKSGASMVQGFALARPEIVPANFHAFGRGGEAAKGEAAQASAEAAEAPALRPQKPVRPFGRRAVS